MSRHIKDQEITFFSSHINGSGGAQKALITLANELIKSGNKVKIFKVNRATAAFYNLSPDIEQIDLVIHQKIPFYFNYPLGRYICHILRMRKVIRSCLSGNIVSFGTSINFLVLLSALGLKKKIIISERNDLRRPDRRWYWLYLQKWLYPKAAYVTSNSLGVLAQLQGIVPNKNLVHTPNPLYLPELPQHPVEKKKYILAVGGLRPQKGYDVLFSAIEKIDRKCMMAWRLRILGDGPLRKDLEYLASNLGINELIEWLGVDMDPAKYFLESSIFVLPSRWEGVPNAMLEAMTFGMPIIVSAVDGALEYVEHEKDGLVVPIDDPHALAEAMEHLIKDEKARLQLGEAALNKSREVAKNNTIKVWEEILYRPN